MCGGLPATTDLIENYPGFPDGINGMQLINKFKDQVLRFGTSILEYDEVKSIESVGKRINVQTSNQVNHILTSINGNALVNSVIVKNRQNDEVKKIEVSGVFIYAGFMPNSKFLEGIVELDDLGYIITNDEMETSIPGIYAVGDIRSKKVRQIDVACGEGTIAAVSVRDYINRLV